MIDEEKLRYARAVNLPAFLENELGLKPVSLENNGRFYLSPLGYENTPSFHVSYRDGVWLWYDHRTAEKAGGDAIALLRRLGYSFKESVDKLAQFNGHYDRWEHMKKIPDEYASSSRKDAKLEKVMYARKFYADLPDSETHIRKYFGDRRLEYYPQIGARLFVDFKNSTKYIAVPVPHIFDIRGIEMREYFSVTKELSGDFRKKRKCYGMKSLWILKRETRRFLVAESILDSLAAEKLFGMPDATLIALNGVGQAAQVEKLLKHARPDEVFLALDNDEPGREAANVVQGIFSKYKIKTVVLSFEAKDPLKAYLGGITADEMKRTS